MAPPCVAFGMEDSSHLPLPFISSCYASRDVAGILFGLYALPCNASALRCSSGCWHALDAEGRWTALREREMGLELVRVAYRILSKHCRKHGNAILDEFMGGDFEGFEDLKEYYEQMYDDGADQVDEVLAQLRTIFSSPSASAPRP
jgi:hypothetical protein